MREDYGGRPNRPLGVLVISIFDMIVGASLLLTALALASAKILGLSGLALLPRSDAVLAVVECILAVFSVVFLALGYLLLNGSEYGRLAQMSICLVGILWSLPGIVMSLYLGGLRVVVAFIYLISIGINTLLILYLRAGHVVRYFRLSRERP